MTPKLKIILAIIPFYLMLQEVNGQSIPPLNKEFQVSGKIEGSVSDTLSLLYYRDAFDSFIPVPNYQAITDRRGEFCFNLPFKPRFGNRISIYLKSKPHSIPIIGLPAPIEVGDSIFISIKKAGEGTEVHFSGRGEAKYNCFQAIASTLNGLFENSRQGKGDSSGGYKVDDKISLNFWDSSGALNQLEEYKNVLSVDMYNLIKTDIRGFIGTYNISPELNGAFYKAAQNLDYHEKRKLEYVYYKLLETVNTNDKKSISNSSYYINYLQGLSQIKISFVHTSCLYADWSLKDMYFMLKNSYSGSIREQLILATLFQGIQSEKMPADSVIALWKDAYSYIQDSRLRKFIKNQIGNRSRGNRAYDFCLPDVNGKPACLHELKGKVVVVDIWFTGCAGCLAYSSRLDYYIYPVFKNKKDVVFVSISGDRDKNTWLHSVKEGKYTRPENINLYTDGKGFNHPFTEHYGFNGGPYSLLIDKNGNIFTADPPKDDMEALIHLIEEAESMK